MKNQVDAAIRAVKAAKREISQIKDKLSEEDLRRGTVDDAEMGADWILKRLEQLTQAPPLPKE